MSLVVYCTNCGIRIDDRAMQRGKALARDGSYFCERCMEAELAEADPRLRAEITERRRGATAPQQPTRRQRPSGFASVLLGGGSRSQHGAHWFAHPQMPAIAMGVTIGVLFLIVMLLSMRPTMPPQATPVVMQESAPQLSSSAGVVASSRIPPPRIDPLALQLEKLQRQAEAAAVPNLSTLEAALDYQQRAQQTPYAPAAEKLVQSLRARRIQHAEQRFAELTRETEQALAEGRPDDALACWSRFEEDLLDDALRKRIDEQFQRIVAFRTAQRQAAQFVPVTEPSYRWKVIIEEVWRFDGEAGLIHGDNQQTEFSLLLAERSDETPLSEFYVIFEYRLMTGRMAAVARFHDNQVEGLYLPATDSWRRVHLRVTRDRAIAWLEGETEQLECTLDAIQGGFGFMLDAGGRCEVRLPQIRLGASADPRGR